jgi:phage baseplate assembly protein W
MTTTPVIYSDIPTNLTIHPIRGDMVLLTNENAVKRSIRNLILTDPYERFFNPGLSTGVKASLFENINRDSESILTNKITDIIDNYEPRANLIRVIAKALPDDNAYNVSIIFSINNNVNPITLDLVLRRVR